MKTLVRLGLSVVFLGTLARADPPQADRPSEEDLFGGARPAPSAAPAPATNGNEAAPTANTTPPGSDAREDPFGQSGIGPVDPLKIGGQIYLRAFTQAAQGTAPSQYRLSAPTLVDAYFDARPNERVRGFVLGRLSYDPTLDSTSTAFNVTGTSSSPLAQTSNPAVFLDQAWLRFDIARLIFVTAGQQHVRWGTSRFWSPTDFLTPQRRNPLLPFDPRTGASMVKLHLPFEKKGWNFYGIALLDNAGPASLLGKVGAAFRAEVLIGQAEVGLDAVFQKNRRPRFGLDFSAPLGPLDIYGEAALKTGSEVALWHGATVPNPDLGPAGLVERAPYPSGLTPAVSGGINWTLTYGDNKTLTLGAEYFYNSLGYTDSAIYPWLIFQNAFQPFYVGQHYGALYVLLPAPWDKTHSSFTLSNLGNLSDRSFVSRLDYSVRVLTHLTLEAFGAVHYGRAGGEFRLQLRIPENVVVNGVAVPPLFLPAPVFELGVGARISI